MKGATWSSHEPVFDAGTMPSLPRKGSFTVTVTIAAPVLICCQQRANSAGTSNSSASKQLGDPPVPLLALELASTVPLPAPPPPGPDAVEPEGAPPVPALDAAP